MKHSGIFAESTKSPTPKFPCNPFDFADPRDDRCLCLFRMECREEEPDEIDVIYCLVAGESEAAEALPIVAPFNKRYTNDNMARVLLQSIRYRHPHKYVLCRKRPYVDKHRDQVHQKVPFRLRCVWRGAKTIAAGGGGQMVGQADSGWDCVQRGNWYGTCSS